MWGFLISGAFFIPADDAVAAEFSASTTFPGCCAISAFTRILDALWRRAYGVMRCRYGPQHPQWSGRGAMEIEEAAN